MEQEDTKQTKRWVNIFIGSLLLFIAGFFIYGFSVANKTPEIKVSGGATPTIALTGYVSYKGHAGFNALELLKAQAQIEESAPGIVIGINGRKPDLSQNEYWAFYINGKFYQDRPETYKTKDEDFMEWKIERN